MSATEPAVNRLPSPLTLALVVVATLLVVVAFVHNLTDADYFWHFATGRRIVETGSVPVSDPFSFTWGGHPWVAHEWLGELLIYALVTIGGPAVAMATFGLLAAGAVWIPAHLAARLGARTAPIVVSAAIGTVILIPFVTVRPQVFSWLLLGVVVAILGSLRAERPWRAAWLGPLFVLWANLHGLWVVGLAAVVAYLAFTLLGRTPMAGARRWMLVGAAAALVAVMVTPAGPAGLLYPLRYIEPGDWGLANIAEWQSPDFHDPVHLALLALIGGLVVTGVDRRVPGWLASLGLIGVVAGLVSIRNEPIAAVWALPLLALGLDGRVRGSEPSTRVRSARQARARRLMELGLAGVTIVALLAILLPRIETTDRAILGRNLPVEGVNVLQARAPRARVFAEYGWAGFVIERFADGGGTVFVDGRNDMYPQEILEAYTSIRAARAGWAGLLDRYGADAILLPPGAPLVSAARESGAWCPAVQADDEVLLLRCSG